MLTKTKTKLIYRKFTKRWRFNIGFDLTEWCFGLMVGLGSYIGFELNIGPFGLILEKK